MNDTKELRRLAQAALIGPDGFSMRWLSLLKDFQEEANPSVISEIIDRLEAAEKERDTLRIENERLRAEVAHVKEVEFPRKAQAVADGWRGKCERLEAKIAEMERQEPVARTTGEIREWVSNGDGTYSLGGCIDAFAPLPDETKLYTLPGAQPAPNLPEAKP